MIVKEWEAEDKETYSDIWPAGEQRMIPIAQCYGDNHKVNAPLMAAAPNLRAACKIGLAYINAVISKVPRPLQDLIQDKKTISEALSKAEGKD